MGRGGRGGVGWIRGGGNKMERGGIKWRHRMGWIRWEMGDEVGRGEGG